MITIVRGLLICAVGMSLGVSGSRPALAETPGEIAKPWTYEGSMKLQQQEQQQQQQQSPSFGQPGPAHPGGGGTPSAGGGGAAAAAAEAARRAWLKRPALPPDRNPLLGSKWKRPASTQANSSDPFAALLAMARGGLCDVLFGGGVFEFRADTLVGSDPQTREQELDRVDYRGDAHHVVVIPRTTIRLMEFDVESPDRINWASQHCVLVRAGSASAGVAATPGSETRAAGAAKSGGVLSMSINSTTPGSINVGGRKLWVLSKDAQLALSEAGLRSTSGGTALQNWIRACQARSPACQQGALALKPYSIGVATTDASGHAQSPPLPAGRYWVFCDGKVDNRAMMWNEPVDVKAGPVSLTLDQRNAKPVD